MKLSENQYHCQVCQQYFDPDEIFPGELVRPFVAETIAKSHPDWNSAGYICIKDLNGFRTKHIQDVLSKNHGDLSKLDEMVVDSLRAHELFTQDLNREFDESSSFGDKFADKIANFGGSWKFIILFVSALLIWIGTNIWYLKSEAFDPYPFILLNLFLSCLAALQAPIIMMSQNRQASKDRLAAENEYKVNLKAELEIRHLKAKIDQLLSHQWRRLLEIQQTQTELLQEIAPLLKKQTS